MKNFLVCDDRCIGRRSRLPSIGVSIIAGKVTTAYLEPNFVSFVKNVACRPQIDFYFYRVIFMIIFHVDFVFAEKPEPKDLNTDYLGQKTGVFSPQSKI